MEPESATLCPACAGGDSRPVYRAAGVPVQSVRLLRDRDAARAFPTGEIDLRFCRSCGFLWNRAFDETLLDYALDYEETQGFSGTFGAFHRELAHDLVARHGLAGKQVLEIGCGKGEFLRLLCELGVGRGLGLDPAFVPARLEGPESQRIEVRRELLAEHHVTLASDAVCCKMTLEHIAAPADFLALVGRSVAARRDSLLFFQVPDVTRILEEGAFWDVYYEHCGYFDPGSLARLFEAGGFAVRRLWGGYDGQYLMIEAQRGAASAARPPRLEEAGVEAFAARAQELVAAWRGYLAAEQAAGRRVALWGGGSKAVAFVSALGDQPALACAVDINPHKQDCFLPGSGLPVVGPEALAALGPTSVIAMNPIYRAEIAAELERLGLAARLLTVERAPEEARAA